MRLKNFESDTELERIKKDFIRNFIISLLFALLFYAVMNYYIGIIIGLYLNIISILVMSCIYYIFFTINYQFKTYINFGLVFITLIVYVNLLVFKDTVIYLHLSLFCPLLFSLLLKPFKVFLGLGVITLTLFLSVKYVAYFLDINFLINLSASQTLLMNYSGFVWTLYFLAFVIHYLKRGIELGVNFSDSNDENFIRKNDYKDTGYIKQYQVYKEKFDHVYGMMEGDKEGALVNENINDSESKKSEISLAYPEHTDNLKNKSSIYSEKFEELCDKIEIFFVEKKPYQNPDYTINKLATDLNTNSSYISKALSQKKGTNFKTLLNYYRIKEIKEKLDNKENEKFTLKYIYNNAGFTYQPTFNRVFKEVEGITPSEYIERLK